LSEMESTAAVETLCPASSLYSSTETILFPFDASAPSLRLMSEIRLERSLQLFGERISRLFVS
jgi:hypothetical protein